ncbi:unnamed protein product, partial [Peniophora sp. CBMAI 1063]
LVYVSHLFSHVPTDLGPSRPHPALGLCRIPSGRVVPGLKNDSMNL